MNNWIENKLNKELEKTVPIQINRPMTSGKLSVISKIRNDNTFKAIKQ